MSKQLVDFQRVCQARIDSLLDSLLIAPEEPLAKLYESMRYSVLLGGKRVRPLLVYSACEALGGGMEQADAAACSVELIHAYSLIHDDLPAMDNAELRRGKLSNHKAYDEATAILAGDGLQALAFDVLVNRSHNLLPAQTILHMTSVLAKAIGPAGMVGGQAIDLASEGKALSLSAMELLHRHKTGALIEASVTLGALASNKVSTMQLAALQRYAQIIGLTFQVQDDILDVESDTETLGKIQGADIANHKATYPALMGLEEAKCYVNKLTDQAISSLDVFSSEANILRALARYIATRRY